MSQQPPAWMESLVAVVSDCIEAHSAMGPLGFRYREEEEIGELIVYPTPVELRGGTTDGTVVLAGFSLDLQALGAAFEQVVGVHWCAHGFGPHDLEGAHVSIEGIYQGHNVWLRVLADPPEDEEPGLQLDTSAQS